MNMGDAAIAPAPTYRMGNALALLPLLIVWLLKIPGLLFVGGAMLIWIAYRLLLPSDDGDEAHGPAATTFWGAMRTIVIADAVMGLDNVLAVAGAAHGR